MMSIYSPIDDYLDGALEITGTVMQAGRFAAHLDRYVASKHRQCCLCSSAAPAEHWMAANAPANVGVQVFSNRLEGGAEIEPKRYICPICRTQYILERLAWNAHPRQAGRKQTTFYLHLFRYSFFTRPLLTAWWSTVRRLAGQELGSFFVRADEYFRDWQATREASRSRG